MFGNWEYWKGELVKISQQLRKYVGLLKFIIMPAINLTDHKLFKNIYIYIVIEKLKTFQILK